MKQGQSETVMELLLAEGPQATAERNGVAVGKLIGFETSGQPLVEVPGDSPGHSWPARTTVTLNQIHIGSDVVLAFEGGETRRPIVMGVLLEPDAAQGLFEPCGSQTGVVADLDTETLTLTAQREIVLRCGEASITLTRAGKVLIRGLYLLSRSSGVNQIKGASVQIN